MGEPETTQTRPLTDAEVAMLTAYVQAEATFVLAANSYAAGGAGSVVPNYGALNRLCAELKRRGVLS